MKENTLETEKKLEKVAGLYGLKPEALKKSTQWKNKRRTLVLSSRGILARHRHLMNDMRQMMPHHKAESKFEKNDSITELVELSQMHSCSSCLFFEAKKTELYLWVSRVKGKGPSCKFQVLNVHTMSELKFSGNCLLASRPILSFDTNFESTEELKMMRGLLQEAFAVPKDHPESKPFHDHTLSFHYFDNKIYMRHYQIQPHSINDAEDPDKVNLVEVGPRLVLEPIKIIKGAFQGKCLWRNGKYMSPVMIRRAKAEASGSKNLRKNLAKVNRAERMETLTLPEKEFSFHRIFEEGSSDEEEDEDDEAEEEE